MDDGSAEAVGEGANALEATVEADEGEADSDEVARPGKDEAGESAHELDRAITAGTAGESGREEEGQEQQRAKEELAEQANNRQEDDVEDVADAAHHAVEVVVLDTTCAAVFVGVEAAVAAGGGAGRRVATAVGASGGTHGCHSS